MEEAAEACQVTVFETSQLVTRIDKNAVHMVGPGQKTGPRTTLWANASCTNEIAAAHNHQPARTPPMHPTTFLSGSSGATCVATAHMRAHRATAAEGTAAASTPRNGCREDGGREHPLAHSTNLLGPGPQPPTCSDPAHAPHRPVPHPPCSDPAHVPHCQEPYPTAQKPRTFSVFHCPETRPSLRWTSESVNHRKKERKYRVASFFAALSLSLRDRTIAFKDGMRFPARIGRGAD